MCFFLVPFCFFLAFLEDPLASNTSSIYTCLLVFYSGPQWGGGAGGRTGTQAPASWSKAGCIITVPLPSRFIMCSVVSERAHIYSSYVT